MIKYKQDSGISAQTVLQSIVRVLRGRAEREPFGTERKNMSALDNFEPNKETEISISWAAVGGKKRNTNTLQI